MKTVMVAGGAGFIGAHLCRELVSRGYQVICVDNLQRGTKENIAEFSSCPNFQFSLTDVRDQAAIEKLLTENKVDYVFHLAANTDLWESMKNPDLEHECTFMTTNSLLNAMRNQKVHSMFFASTSAIYGLQTSAAFMEDDNLCPISYYGAAKMASEAYLYAFAYMNDMNILIYRFSNIIGSKMTHGVIHDFIGRLKDDPSHLDVRGNGWQTKPYLHVSELIQAIMMLAGKEEGVSIYNVGATTCTNVRFIADKVVREMGMDEIPICYENKTASWKGDVTHYEYNVDRINSKGWHSTMTSDEAVCVAIAELVAEAK